MDLAHQPLLRAAALRDMEGFAMWDLPLGPPCHDGPAPRANVVRGLTKLQFHHGPLLEKVAAREGVEAAGGDREGP